MADSFDVVVIGGGPGGYVTALKLAIHGRSVALVEKEKLGGTCLHRGCIPAKVYLESAGFFDRVQHGAADLGVKIAKPELDFGQIAKRRDKIVAANEGGIKLHLKNHGVESIQGTAQLVGPGEVRVGDRRIKAKDVILATGSTPRPLPGVEPDGERVLTSDHVTTWGALPKSIVIVGAGAVGAELASAMGDFGVETTLLEFLPRVLPREDVEVSTAIARSFQRRKIQVVTDAKVLPESVKSGKSGVKLEVEVKGERKQMSAECLLVATSRDPLTEGLGLDKTKVKVERGAVKVDPRTMQTDEPHVYAIGDLVGGLMLAHAAHAEGDAAIAAILGHRPQPVDYDAVPRATYTRPEVASIGLTEEEARKAGHELQVGKFSFRANAKALIAGDAEGFVKIVSDGQTGEIVGVHMVGPHVTELIGELSVAKLLESTPLEVGLAVHPHPTLSEAVAEAALDVTGEAIHVSPRRRSTAAS